MMQYMICIFCSTNLYMVLSLIPLQCNCMNSLPRKQKWAVLIFLQVCIAYLLLEVELNVQLVAFVVGELEYPIGSLKED